MNIIYVIFGDNIIYHIQTYLSIRTFQKQLDNSDKIFVMTTKPELYKHGGVNVIPISDDTIHEWEGDYHFFWRVKIKAMEYMSNHYPDGHLLYLDTDTFLFGQLSNIKERLLRGEGIMHKDEGHPSLMMSRSKKMWKQIANKYYDGIKLGMKHHMFNAGVVAIPQEKIDIVISKALAICDSMLAQGVERVVIEQYSLSISLYENTILTEGNNCIGHYWGNKEEWERFAMDIISKAYMQNLSIKEEISLINDSDLYKIPIHIHHSSTAAKIRKIIDRIFKDKNIIYIKQN
ncbi:MAG: hypothetical protein IJQ60_11785 [Prevotella sp.]|nr:hypothetical protein [Prevotella sp.]